MTCVNSFLLLSVAPLVFHSSLYQGIFDRDDLALELHEAVVDQARNLIGPTALASVSLDCALMEAGVDSLGAVELRNQLQRAMGESVALSSTLMFDFPTARGVAAHLQDGVEPRAAPVGGGAVGSGAASGACSPVWKAASCVRAERSSRVTRAL